MFRSSARVLLCALLAALCAASAGCAASAWTTGGMARTESPLRVASVSEVGALAPAAVTLTWTMPTRKANGDTLSTAPLDWQAAYSTQSQTWRNHAYWMKYNADTLAYYWPAVVAEAAPLVVMSGTGVPGWHMSVVAVPVQAWDFPFSYWVRTRQRPNGQWSLWSNPVSRANND